MRIPYRFLQCTFKFTRTLLVTTWIFSVSCVSFAQNPPTTAAAASASSAASSAPPEKPIYKDNNDRDNALLAKALTAIAKADELQWLETPDEKVLSLYKAGETRKTLGLLLIMHSPEIPQLWPANLENIRRNLPLYSWSTVALPLPAKYSVTVPARESSVAASTAAESAAASSTPTSVAASASAAASSEPAKPVIARDKLIAGRVDAAIEQINKLGKLDLAVLVDNSSAPDALAALYQKLNITSANFAQSPLKALVLVNLQDQEPLTKEQLTAIFSANNLRVMDVFFNPDNKAQSDIRRLHQAEAMRQNVRDYQQVILQNQPVPSIEDTQSFWLGKIHGFLMRKSSSSQSSSSSSASATN